MSPMRAEKALERFRNGYNCAQSIFSIYGPEFGMDEILAKAAASGFGGGMGALQKICGAVTGGIFVLGCRFFNDGDRRLGHGYGRSNRSNPRNRKLSARGRRRGKTRCSGRRKRGF